VQAITQLLLEIKAELKHNLLLLCCFKMNDVHNVFIYTRLHLMNLLKIYFKRVKFI